MSFIDWLNGLISPSTIGGDNNKRPDPVRPVEDKMDYAPQFCHSDGKLLQLVKTGGRYDEYNGRELFSYFVECPNIKKDNHETWEHGRYQWMEGNGKNSTWLPLDNF